MPYIPNNVRHALDLITGSVRSLGQQTTPGESNYVLTTIVLAFLGESPDYAGLERMLGRLEALKLETWRRMMVPYEDGKRAANGDVYPSEQEIRDHASERR